MPTQALVQTGAHMQVLRNVLVSCSGQCRIRSIARRDLRSPARWQKGKRKMQHNHDLSSIELSGIQCKHTLK